MPNPGLNSQAIPLLDLSRQYQSIRDEVLPAIERVCSTQQFILGPEVEALEHEIAAYIGAKAAVGCASGTDALWLALAGSGIKPGDGVITTPFSFFASASSIVRTEAMPIFVDIDPKTLNLDPAKVKIAVERALTKRKRKAQKSATGGVLRAILPVHLYGQCAEMDSLRAIANEFGLILIEDAAQAIGAKWNGKSAGSMGKAAAFSFYPTKNLSAFGEAGIVTTQSQSIAERMRRLRNHGSPKRYLHTEFGWNARLDAIQAAVLRVKLKHIENWNQRRRERAQIYDRLFCGAGFQEFGAKNSTSGRLALTKASPLRPLWTSPQAHHVFHQYVVRVRNRDGLRKFLAEHGIATEVYYPIPLHLQPVFAYLKYKRGDLPESERASREVLALPIFSELTFDEQQCVVGRISEFYS